MLPPPLDSGNDLRWMPDVPPGRENLALLADRVTDPPPVALGSTASRASNGFNSIRKHSCYYLESSMNTS